MTIDRGTASITAISAVERISVEVEIVQYTGIRAVPLVTPRRIMQPHLARYAFAAQMAGAAHTVLDIACGTGYGASLLRRAGCARVWGVDLDRSALVFGRSNFGDYSSVGFVQANACDLPFDTESFDLVTCFETFEHILDSHRFMAELKRVIRPAGLLIISTPHAPLFAPFSKQPDLRKDYIRLGLGHKYNIHASAFNSILENYFNSVVLFGQNFRRISMLTRVRRQVERLAVGARYRIARHPRLGAKLQPWLGDVLAQDNLIFDDPQWAVRPWEDQATEPIFCVAVCREKKP